MSDMTACLFTTLQVLSVPSGRYAAASQPPSVAPLASAAFGRMFEIRGPLFSRT